MAEEVIAGERTVFAPYPPPAAHPTARQEPQRLPLAQAQRRFGFLAGLDARASSAYLISVALHLQGALDVRALRTALDALRGRHEALRAHLLPSDDGDPGLCIVAADDGGGFALAEYDLRASPETLDALLERESLAPFDLQQGPLIRACLVALAPQEHVFALNVHHLIFDATSMQQLLRELDAAYRVAARGEAVDTAPARRFTDCIVVQGSAAWSERLQQQYDFWRRTLDHAPLLSTLPADRRRAARHDFDGGFVHARIDAASTARLRALSRRHGASLFGVLLAGWAALLQRLGAQDEAVVGLSTSGRTREEFRDVIGCFVGTVPVRVAASGATTAAELVRETAERLRAAAANQDLPFERIVDAARVERNLAQNPLFQTLLNWYGTTHEPLGLGDLMVAPVDGLLRKFGITAPPTAADAAPLMVNGGTVEHVVAKLDLSLLLWESSGEITIGAEYATALFDATTVQRHLRYWIRLLAAFADDDTQPIRAIDLLDAQERECLLRQWNATAVAGSATTVTALFREQAARAPAAVALEHGARMLSYAELESAALALAARLHGQGIGRGRRIAVALERGAVMVVALLGVLHAGAAYVPLDAELPAARREHILRDAGVDALLVDDARAAAAWAPAGLVLIEVDVAGVPAPTAAPLPVPEPHDLAYVLYTSGTTGLPKGVMVEHASVTNLLLAMRTAVAMQPDDRVLALTTLGFDIAALELFLPLIGGARIVMADRAVARDPFALARLIAERGISLAQATPTTWRMLLDSGWRGAPSMRALSGGEALSSALAAALLPRVGALWNVYGPTETTIWSTLQRVTPASTEEAAGVAIGRPIANTCVYVLDALGNSVPVGVVGELHIAGAGVARGYVGMDELTAQRFLPDPFVPGQRMYRSGDLACWDAHGVLHHRGRNDSQIKLHGHRIEPAEIEAQLRRCEAVAEAIVVLKGDRLVAYCVLREPTEPAPEQRLRTQLLAQLPSYMVPERYIVLARLPLSPNGKIDVAALPEPDPTAAPLREAPRAGLESEIAAVWSELLDGRRIDRRDQFFRIGGHSLLAARVIARLRNTLGLDVGVAELFAQPTLAEFAAVAGRSGAAPVPALAAVPRDGVLPLSFAQQRLWFVAQTGDDASRAYHMPIVLRLAGVLDLDALRQALAALLARHEALRTRFPAVDGQPRQQVLAYTPALLLLRESAVDAADPAAIEAAVDAELDRRFDLAHEIPLRALVLHLGPTRSVLVITVHHIASDGWSLGLFLNELRAGYNAARAGRPLAMTAPDIQYADYAQWQRRSLSGALLDQHARYWKERLADAPALFELPADRPRPPQQDFAGDYVECAIAPQLTAALRALAERSGTTLFVAVLASWSALLARLSGVSDLVVGTPVANRGHRAVETLIGFFANTLALRVRLDDDPSVRTLVERCRDEVLAAQRHGELPFEQLVEVLRPARSPAYTPIFQVALAWQSVAPVALALDGLTVSQQLLRPGKTAKFDLTLYLWETADGISGGIEYATSLFERTTIERWLAHWQVLLQAFVADEGQALSRLAVLDAPQRERLLHEWACSAPAREDARPVQRRIADWARRTPQAVAVRQRDLALSYAQLDAEAERLRAVLAAAGVGAHSRVGVRLPRSPQLIVALLAVLKAGGAYLLLDPALPDERLRYMLDDCAADVLIAETASATALLRPGRRLVDPLRMPADTPPTSAADAEGAIAYLIYTSGSSGRPKGIAIEHRGLANLVDWLVDALELQPGRNASGVCGLAFDASVIDIWPTLCAGATLLLTPVEATQDADALLRWWATQPLHSSMLPTPLAEIALAQGDFPASLRVLATGGARLGRHAPANTGFRLLNLYGPAETSVVATFDRVASSGPIAIGRPIPGMRAYVLDKWQQPQPVGVVGELYLAGVGVAADYLGLPELSAEVFGRDPFSAEPQQRLYRTGDLVRWLADGRIEFVGRDDEQVKLRGMRIELGEIESALVELSPVREAAVVAVGEAASAARLVAYVGIQDTPADEAMPLGDERIAEWTRLYDDNYRAPDTALRYDFHGWNSSYTGAPIALLQMQEWQQQTVARIRALQPRRVLEIGCGSGLLLLDLAAQCERYVGLDFSREALDNLQRKVDREELRSVQLLEARADELGRLGEERFDTVIVNSVIQYFPDRAYLDGVLAAALQRLGDGGNLFVGDVRNRSLADAFHASIHRFREGAGRSSEQWRLLARQSLRQEKELLVTPRYFRELQQRLGLGALQLMPKAGSAPNELTKYRYDVVLRPAAAAPVQRKRFDGAVTPDALDQALRALAQAPQAVAVVTGLRNAFVEPDADLIEPPSLAPAPAPACNVAEALARARAAGWVAQASWLGSDRRGGFHLLIARDEAMLADHATLLDDQPEPDGEATNAPVQLLEHTRLQRDLVAALARRLPDYMIPVQFVFLPRLPLTPNGKVDRAALPPPEHLAREKSYVAPSTPTERLLATVWSEVLGCPAPGVHDHFFALGGHSLAAVQVLARLRRELGVDLLPPDLFAHPELADFARFVDAAATGEAAPITRIERRERLAPSFEQEGLWFLARLPGAGAAYNIVFGLRLRGRLDVGALQAALDTLTERHEALRTRFVDIEGRPYLRIDGAATCPLRSVALSAAQDADSGLRHFIDDEIDRRFDLETGPLFRASLLREAEHSHVLVLALHHIVGDGWSVRVLLRDLAALYGGATAADLPALPIQFADWAAAQRMAAERHRERHAAYWQALLHGAPPLLELATDRPRPTQQDFRGGFLACRLDAALSARVHAAARRHDTTPFVLLLASWALLLSRLANREDLVIGMPSANRASPETQDLVGLLVSTLPLRLDLSGAPRLSELLERVERQSLQAQQHQDIAFEKIVELVSPARSLAYNPIFQVMFAWQSGSAVPPSWRGLDASALLDCSPRHAKFDLSLILSEDADGIHGGIEYAAALFDEATIERYREHWLTVLQQFVDADDATTTDRIELLSPAQRELVLERWNDTARDFPDQRCLHDLFEERVAATPEAIALECEDERLSYAALDAQAAQLVAHLRDCGVRAGSFVAIHIARSTAMVVAVLATLKAGAAYVPLDIAHPAARKAYMLNDCRPGWLLHAGTLPSFEGLEQPPLAIDVGRVPPAAAPPTRVPLASTELAYIIYTSGSTGLPKGVMLEHRPVVNRLLWMQREFAIGPDHVVLQKTTLGFDISVWELFLPLICGARLVLAAPDAHRDPEKLARTLREKRITLVHFVPSMLRQFLAQRDSFDFPDLRHVVCSGEELPPAIVEDFRHKLPEVDIHNLYGPTEAAIEVSWHRCRPDHGAARIPIGRPIDNCRLYVLDAQHRPLPPGVPGELYIGGLPLARGYWNRPALSAERFLPDPFVADVHGRMYKTGDQARWLADGEIEFLGRNDAQVKLRGFRIELSEIEIHLARYPGVEEAAVAVRDDAALGPSLVAYWVGDDDFDAAALRAHLAATLPDYMVPAFFVRLTQLPLNPNGKLDRNALPAPNAEAVPLPSTAPQGAVEEAVAAAWQDVLGRGGLGRDDNFFALGGHSLLTLRLRNRLESAGLGVEVADLFRYPTIAGLAAVLARRETAAGESAVDVVRAEGEGSPLFLLHDGFGLALYAHTLAARLPGGFPVYALNDTASAQNESASITLLADRLFAALRATQPQGPYRLAGWSFGGLLAYELATRLVDAGETVAYLGLIDSYYRFDEPTTDDKPDDFAEVPVHVAALPPALRRQCLARNEIYALAARCYVARPLHLAVDLIKAERCEFAAMRAWRGWERVLPTEAIRLHEVPGCHYSMMTAQFVDAVAQALMLGLARAADQAA
jgi:amino acid adenylation domain-containing protein